MGALRYYCAPEYLRSAERLLQAGLGYELKRTNGFSKQIEITRASY
jgi:hypothetical protein